MNPTRYFKLGLFVLLGIGMILGTVLALGAGRLLQKRVLAETVVDESVDGLDVGAPVKYRGVTIGSVVSIAFTADRDGAAIPVTDRIARYVRIDLALNESTFRGMTQSQIDQTLKRMIASGLRARLDQQGIVLSQQEDIQQIIADLRRTADNLAAVSGDIRDDPARLIFSQPPPRKTPGE